MLSVLSGVAGPRASNPALRTLYDAGIASPTLICLCMFLDARHRALPLRTQLFWAAMSIVVPSFTLAVYAGHILRHVKR